MGVDVLIAGLGSTAGLRRAEDELLGSLRRAGASAELVRPPAPREVRTFALTDLVWAVAARRAAAAGIAAHDPRAVVYSTVGAALLWPRPGAIRFDAPARANRPGHHGLWQRPVERRRMREASLLIPQDAGALAECPQPRADALVVPIAVDASGPNDGARDIAALAYAANPHKKGLDRIIAAWEQARREGEELVVAGTKTVPDVPGVLNAGLLSPEDFRALLRRTRVLLSAARREDYGLAQLEALADGARLVTTEAPGPYAALPLARALDDRLVVARGDDVAGLARAIRTALDDPSPGYAERAAAAIAPFSRAAVDRVVADELLPRLLHPGPGA